MVEDHLGKYKNRERIKDKYRRVVIDITQTEQDPIVGINEHGDEIEVKKNLQKRNNKLLNSSRSFITSVHLLQI